MLPAVLCDSSALIDLEKVDLFPTLLELPFRFFALDLMLERELRKPGLQTVHQSRFRSLHVATLTGKQIGRASVLAADQPALSFLDCAVLILALESGSMLLTGDRRLREISQAQGVEVHGVLWCFDRMLEADVISRIRGLEVLDLWRSDLRVRLPEARLNQRIQLLRRNS